MPAPAAPPVAEPPPAPGVDPAPSLRHAPATRTSIPNPTSATRGADVNPAIAADDNPTTTFSGPARGYSRPMGATVSWRRSLLTTLVVAAFAIGYYTWRTGGGFARSPTFWALLAFIFVPDLAAEVGSDILKKRGRTSAGILLAIAGRLWLIAGLVWLATRA
jgi:hypothetical protein